MRFASIGLIAVAGLLLLGATGIPAKAASVEPMSFTVTLVPNVDGDADRVWRDDDGVLHVRGDPRWGDVTGDITATIFLEDNRNVVMGNGDAFGTFTVTTSEGSWSGRYSGTVSGTVNTLDWVGQGSGGLDGTKLQGTSVGSGRVHVFTGMVLDPHG